MSCLSRHYKERNEAIGEILLLIHSLSLSDFYFSSPSTHSRLVKKIWWSGVFVRWSELKKILILYVDDEIKYAREKVERGEEFNLISHNRTYNLARTNWQKKRVGGERSGERERKVSLECSWDLIWKYFQSTHTWHKIMFIYFSLNHKKEGLTRTK